MILFNRLIATFFYSGFLPYFPGTWGSLAAAIIWWFIPEFLPGQLLLILITILLGIVTSNSYAKQVNKKDPSEVVIDEVAGMWLALLWLPKEIPYFFAAFVLFRLLDIAKPSVIDKVQNLPGGTGIMMDDILAGMVSGIIVAGALFLL